MTQTSNAFTPMSDRSGAGTPLGGGSHSVWLTTSRRLQQASNVVVAVRLTAPVAPGTLEAALAQELAQHKALRSKLAVVDGRLVAGGVRRQIVAFEAIEPRSRTAVDLDCELATGMFDLAEGPVVYVRAQLVSGHIERLTVAAPQVLINDRALLDCIALALRRCGFPSAAPEQLGIQPATAPETDVTEALRHCAPLVDVGALRARPALHPEAKAWVTRELAPELAQELKQLAHELNLEAEDVLFAAAAVLICRYSGRASFALGSLTGDADVSVPVPIPVEVDGVPDFASLARTLASMRAACRAGTPYEALVRELAQESTAYNPIFQVLFAFHDLEPAQRALAVTGIVRATERLDLELTAVAHDAGLRLTAMFSHEVVDRGMATRMLVSYERVLRAVARAPQQAIATLSLLTEPEYETLLRLNDTAEPYDDDDCIHSVFERQVASTPDRVAYVFEARSFTYSQFNEACNRVAHRLRELGVAPEVPVALFVGRCEWMGIGALAIMKSGGVYVPLDPAYPSDRIGYMLSSVSPGVVLTTRKDGALLPPTSARVLVLDDDAELARMPPTNPAPTATGSNTAYVLFTSGTTGKPKAIQMPHRAFRNMPLAHASRGLLHPDNRVLQFASVAFAVSLGGSFMAWLSGGALYQVNDAQSVPGNALFELLRSQRINMVSWPVSLLASLPDIDLPDLQTVISTAEPCTDAVARRWCKGRRFINMYGSSEVAMGSTLFEWREGAMVTLGTPFPNTEIYVVDEELNPVPVGVVGEICIGGRALANGYLHRPDATADKFLPNPFSSTPGKRLYRTGDLGRYLPSGEIQYVGRRDFQVSIRGFRIEVMEVERALSAVDGVEAAAVSVRPDPFGRDRLVAYVVGCAGQPFDRAATREALARTLPDYMIPSLFVTLEALPLTPNRKLDRLRLPEPDLAAQLEDGYEEPVGPTERALAEIWAKALNVERVGRSHGFFHIGGHSLLAAIVITHVKTRLDIDVPLRVLIEHDTIRAFAAELERLSATNAGATP